MPGSRVPVAFFVDDGALMIVASTIVPVLTVMPWARRWSRTASNRVWPSPCCSSRWRNLQTVVSSGTGSRPRSIPTNARIVGESYSASSTAGSERLNQCWRQYIRSIRSTPTGGRPFPGWGYTGSIRAPSSRHGTTRSISARNCARRVTFVYFSNPVLASVGCERVIATSRSCVRLLVASQHNSRERERLIQSFPNAARRWAIASIAASVGASVISPYIGAVGTLAVILCATASGLWIVNSFFEDQTPTTRGKARLLRSRKARWRLLVIVAGLACAMFPVSAYVFRSKDEARDAHRRQIRSEAIKAIDRAQGDGKRIDLDMHAQIPLIATIPIVNRFTFVPGQVRKLSEAEVKVFARRIERWKGSTQAMLMSCLPTS